MDIELWDSVWKWEQVALASGLKYTDKVREAQLGMKMENLVCVDAMGLELQEDNLHLTTHSQVILGQMLVDAYFTHFAPPLSNECHSSSHW